MRTNPTLHAEPYINYYLYNGGYHITQQQLQLERARLVEQQLLTELQQLNREKEQVTREKEQVTTEKEQLTTEKEQVTREKEQVTREKEQVNREKEQVTRQKEQVTREKEQVCSLHIHLYLSSSYVNNNVCFIVDFFHVFV